MNEFSTTLEQLNAIPLEGTPERIEALNDQLRKDLAIYATRPFLNKQERNDLGEYFCTWGINKIIALLNFDKSGNYLPEVYQAPKEYLRMLYPIDDIMQYNRQGTLIIDREQYSPELRNLSFFIYMVDEELYDQYKTIQKFNGPTAPTFMFNRFANNGVRIFRDYFALARHLRKQRFITYCLGPRTAFYLRYFLHEIHVHTIDNDDYAYGKHEDATLVNDVIESIKRHLAFNHAQTFDHQVDVTVDNFSQFRALLKNKLFKLNLPDADEFHCKTVITRYRKQRLLGSAKRVKTNKQNRYKQMFDIEPYHHMMLTNDYALFYVWDTRQIQKVLPATDIDINDFTAANDNGFDLCASAKHLDKEAFEICDKLHTTVAIQMRDNA